MTIKLGLLNDVQVRFLCPADVDEVKRLCREWFPIEYPDVWYEEITSSSRFFSLAATLNHDIIGLLVAEVKTKSLCNKEDAGILSFAFGDDSQVAYILSIGVVKQYRRHGIGTLLLDSLLSHLTTPEKQNCKAVYLHVLTTNSAAMKFYDKRHFKQFRYLPLYYAINGTHKDGFSYVLYINGGEPPWTLGDALKFLGAKLSQLRPCKLPLYLMSCCYHWLLWVAPIQAIRDSCVRSM